MKLRDFIVTVASNLALASTVQAAAPQVRTQAPGYYRLMLGKFEVTALLDGTIDLPLDTLLRNTTPAATEAALARGFLETSAETSVNAYLINTGSKLVLVDAGDPVGMRPGLGKLANNLRSAGYRPEQVDAVLLTHMHRDHVGGLTNGHRRVFPNATVYANQNEAAYWLDPEKMATAPAAVRSFFEVAMTSINPYVKSGKFRAIDGELEILAGIHVRPTPGHTPGHSTYIVESDGEELVLWGDILHVAAIQFSEPSVTLQFDVDARAAIAERERAYADAAKRGYLVGGSHLPFPGLGHVRAEDDGYLWIPVNYTVPR